MSLPPSNILLKISGPKLFFRLFVQLRLILSKKIFYRRDYSEASIRIMGQILGTIHPSIPAVSGALFPGVNLLEV